MIDLAPGKIFCGSRRFSSPRAMYSISPCECSFNQLPNSLTWAGGVHAATRHESKPRSLAKLTIRVFISVRVVAAGACPEPVEWVSLAADPSQCSFRCQFLDFRQNLFGNVIVTHPG